MRKILPTLAVATGVTIAALATNNTDPEVALTRNIRIMNSIATTIYESYVDSVDMDEMFRTAIDAYLWHTDPYTEYYRQEDSEELTQVSTGEYGGIGAVIQKRGDIVIVSNPTWDNPARMSGLRHGDKILRVDSVDVTADMDVSDVSRRLRGQAGTTVTVTIERPYVSDSIMTFAITRRTITTNPMPYYGVDSTGVGYIKITTFNSNTASDMKQAILKMQSTGKLKALVLDLRDNGGGVLDGAVRMLSMFLPKGTEVLRTRGRSADSEKIYKTPQAPIAEKLPLAVLVNGGSASASEIVAGALQDLDRAVIIGTRSYGKGLVQTSVTVPYGGYLKLTTARYYIPSGRLIQAIDYSHHEFDGTAYRIPDSLRQVWYTKAGRPVLDGGGIAPDVQVSDTTNTRLIYAMLRDNYIYNYATRFASRTASLPSATEWEIGDSIFDDFKEFIDPATFQYSRACEMSLKVLREAAQFEGYMSDTVAAQIDLLEGMLRHNVEFDLDYNRERLTELLDEEISQRFYNEYDCVMRSLRYSAEMETARSILLDAARYEAILSGSGL